MFKAEKKGQRDKTVFRTFFPRHKALGAKSEFLVSHEDAEPIARVKGHEERFISHFTAQTERGQSEDVNRCQQRQKQEACGVGGLGTNEKDVQSGTQQDMKGKLKRGAGD